MIKINQQARNDNLSGMKESIKSFPAMAQLSSGRDHFKKKNNLTSADERLTLFLLSSQLAISLAKTDDKDTLTVRSHEQLSKIT